MEVDFEGQGDELVKVYKVKFTKNRNKVNKRKFVVLA